MRAHALHAARRASAGGAPHWRRLEAPVWAEPASGGRHPLADPSTSLALRRRAVEIERAFAAIEPTLRALAPQQFDAGFADRAAAEIEACLKLTVPRDALAASWTRPLDMAALHARCVLATFARLIARGFDRSLSDRDEGESAATLIHRWGFHAIDISACADGRLSGVLDYILRVPPSVVAFRKSYAGAMFDVQDSLRNWEAVELSRWRNGRPNAADAGTRYLKIGVYHFSSADPHHHGCAAHGSDDARAAGALLERLRQFAEAVRGVHGAAAATLLVGVDTDTDAIRVHVPDARGQMSIDRYADAAALYARTRALAREAAKAAIREAVAACAGVEADDEASEGMRWLLGYLVKNNLSQVDSVREAHGGRYADAGHTERLIIVGDAIDDAQLRNLAFQAQMETVEQGAADLDIGVSILRGLHEPKGLAVPVLAHFGFDARIPGARERAGAKALRLAAAVRERHAELAARGGLFVQAAIRPTDGGAPIMFEPAPVATIKEAHK